MGKLLAIIYICLILPLTINFNFLLQTILYAYLGQSVRSETYKCKFNDFFSTFNPVIDLFRQYNLPVQKRKKKNK